MEKELILQQEASNDGMSLFLYYDEMAGLYVAYGLSAYYTTMVTEPYLSYTEELQMPVALLRREHILCLRQSMKKVDHQVKRFYRFEMKRSVGRAGYEKWEKKIRSAHERIYR